MKLLHKQIIRYLFVGLSSTGAYVVVAFLLLHVFALPLLSANLGASIVPIAISYFGNVLWSFETKSEIRSMVKFLCVTTLTLSLIVLISGWVTAAKLPPYVGIFIIAAIVPVFGFILQKLWVFNR